MGSHVATYTEESDALCERHHREVEAGTACQSDGLLWPLCWRKSSGTSELDKFLFKVFDHWIVQFQRRSSHLILAIIPCPKSRAIKFVSVVLVKLNEQYLATFLRCF